MDVEKSSSSSFEDLTNADDTKDIRAAQATVSDFETSEADVASANIDCHAEGTTQEDESDDDIECDILGNKQLIKRIIKKASANAKRPSRGDLVTITYTGKLEDGTVVEKEERFQCHVGDFEVVQGIDMVLPMMHVGEVSQVNVDQRFGYGTIGLKTENPPEIIVPPNANVSAQF